MKEIKATAPTRKELFEECKRLSEENEKLKRQLKTALSLIEYYESEQENKTND
ncbi:hypothetical protein [Alteromonas phage PB15]|nr:hypothetical protein [Alteromonas phage PB15]